MRPELAKSPPTPTTEAVGAACVGAQAPTDSDTTAAGARLPADPRCRSDGHIEQFVLELALRSWRVLDHATSQSLASRTRTPDAARGPKLAGDVGLDVKPRVVSEGAAYEAVAARWARAASRTDRCWRRKGTKPRLIALLTPMCCSNGSAAADQCSASWSAEWFGRRCPPPPTRPGVATAAAIPARSVLYHCSRATD